MHPASEIERLYRQYGAALVLFGTSMVGERSVAQDAVHQVFLRLIRTGGLSEATDPKAYLFASVRNQLLNDMKVSNRSLTETDLAWFEAPQRDYAAEENLRRALSELPDDQRNVMVLRIWGELTFSQVAEVLGISANTAASRYRYALGKLREVMLPEEKLNADR